MIRRAAVFALFFASGALPVATATPTLSVTSSIIKSFLPGSEQTAFGKLQFMGGFAYSSRDSRLGGVSSIRFRPDGRQFVAVLDTGEWMTGAIARNSNGQLEGLLDVSITPMRSGSRKSISKIDLDAEGLAMRQGELIVSFERRHRIEVYPDPGFSDALPRAMDMVIPKHELRFNGGIETIAVAPSEGRLKGAPVAIAERSVDADGNLFAAVLQGPLKGVFKVARDEPWAVTDGAFLPEGDLLLLERRFSFTGGVGMRIRRIDGDRILPGAIVDGEVLIEAGMEAEIDNMEGLDVIQGPGGDNRIIVVSDDNKSFFQRNLMLEFRLTD